MGKKYMKKFSIVELIFNFSSLSAYFFTFEKLMTKANFYFIYDHRSYLSAESVLFF